MSPRSISNLVGHREKGRNVLQEALKFKSIKRFRDSYSVVSGSRGTDGVYLSAVMAFSRSCSKDPDGLVRMLSKSSQLELVAEVQGFVNHLVKEGKAPKTVQAYLSAVKGFLEINEIDVGVLHRRLRTPRSYIRSMDRAPTLKELRRVYDLPRMELETRALLLFLLSSGCRIGEALQIQRDDLGIVGTVHSVRIRPQISKDRIGRYAFVTSEASETIGVYLKTHSDPRVFPLPMSRAFNKLTRSFGRGMAVQRSEGRRDIHPHCLRKLFFTIALKGVGREIAEALVGHKQYLDAAYRRLTVEEIAGYYATLEPNLTLFPKTPVKEAQSDQIVAQADEVEQLISSGYRFLALLPGGKAIMETPNASFGVKGSSELQNPIQRIKHAVSPVL
jgi:integrase